MDKPTRTNSLPDFSRDFPRLDFSNIDEREEKSGIINIRRPSLKSETQKERPCCTKLPMSYKCVSDWKRHTVEESFNIYYNDDFTGTPADIINRLEPPENLTNEQEEYIETIKKYLNISLGYGELSEIYVAAVLGDRIIADTKLKECLENLDNENEEYIRGRVYKFLCSIMELIEALKLCRNMSDAYEGHSTMLFSAFAELCCLNVKLGMLQSEHSTWKNLGGLDKVISKPDIRLYKYGVLTKSSVDRKRVVSVVKVKKSRNQEYVDLSDSDVENCSSTSTLSSFESRSSNSSENVPKIELLLNRDILGQHAGELLLDLYKYGKKDSNVEPYKILGMIVKGTMVFVTILEMSNQHYSKLTTNHDLEESDRAIIYYSRPFNILNENDRNTLIDSFVKLNNLQ